MIKQMAWLPIGLSGNGEKVLHLRENIGDAWKPYNQTRYKQPDTILSGIKPSQGFRTAQILLKQGWSYVATSEVLKNTETENTESDTIVSVSKISSSCPKTQE